MSKKKKIGIIGLGYVGSAVRYWFSAKGGSLPKADAPREHASGGERNSDKYELFLYDKYKNIGSVQEVNKADIIFIAVPTPFYDKDSACVELHADPSEGKEKRGYDDSAVYDAVSNIKEDKIIVIKSSVLPGTTDKFQEENPGKIFLFNPEFLTAKNAADDFLKPDRQIIGYTNEESREAAETVINILPKAKFTKVIKAREAEMVKFFGNTFLSMRVVFANQMYDFCQKLGIDYESVVECVGRDTRIGHSHFDIFHEGYRGYGGMCFPKDVKALIQLADELGIDLELLRKMDEINEELRKL